MVEVRRETERGGREGGRDGVKKGSLKTILQVLFIECGIITAQTCVRLLVWLLDGRALHWCLSDADFTKHNYHVSTYMDTHTYIEAASNVHDQMLLIQGTTEY